MTGCSLFPGATWTPLHPPSWVQKGMEVSPLLCLLLPVRPGKSLVLSGSQFPPLESEQASWSRLALGSYDVM